MANRIERVEVFAVAMPLNGTFTSGGLSKDATKCIVVRLTAADGTIGISSAEPSAGTKSPGTAAELAVAIRERIAPAIVGLDPTNVNRLIEVLDKLTPNQHGAAAAVEMAAVELAARLQGVPLYTYLGGVAEEKVLFNGWIGMLPAEEAAEEAKRWLAAGFKSSKIKVGSGIEADHDRIEAVRATVGSAMKLRIDANCQYDADTSIRLCRLVKKFDLQLFEQPAPKEDIAGLARVRREGGVPIMADETIDSHESLIAVIKAGAADFVKFGVKQAGGILRSARMLATAEAAGIPVVIGHGFGLDPSTIAEIMVAASSKNVLPGLECVGPLKVVDTVTTTRLDISSGSIPLPQGPGIGLTLDEKKLEQEPDALTVAAANEFVVMTSGAFTAAHLSLVPQLERLTGKKIVTATTSVGTGETSIHNRLKRGEIADIVIVAGPLFRLLQDEGLVSKEGCKPVARSSMGIAVRAGAPKPDVSTVDGFRRALLEAKAVAYSASVSGDYFTRELLQNLGIADEVLPKSRFIGGGERTGAVVARGEADIAFQQMSELMPVPGIAHITPLPPELQRVTEFLAGVGHTTRDAALARKVIDFLASSEVASTVTKTGMELPK